MTKRGLQDNYLGPFDVVARSEKYFTIRLNNGKINNVTVERVKPYFSEADALQSSKNMRYTLLQLLLLLHILHILGTKHHNCHLHLLHNRHLQHLRPERNPTELTVDELVGIQTISCSRYIRTSTSSLKIRQGRGVMWHMPHGIFLLAAPKNANIY